LSFRSEDGFIKKVLRDNLQETSCWPPERLFFFKTAANIDIFFIRAVFVILV